MEHIEKMVAFYLGLMKRAFEKGELGEDLVSNVDDTHFVFNMENFKTLCFIGDSEAKYADVVSGEEAMAMRVRISGGGNVAHTLTDAHLQECVKLFSDTRN